MRLYVRVSVLLQVAMMSVAAIPLMVATGVAVAATQWLFMWHNPAWWTVMRLVGYAIFTGYGCISLSAAWSLWQAHLKQQLRDRWGRIVAVFLSANARAWHALVRTRGAVGGGQYTADSDDWDAMDEAATPDDDDTTATRDPNNPPCNS